MKGNKIKRPSSTELSTAKSHQKFKLNTSKFPDRKNEPGCDRLSESFLNQTKRTVEQTSKNPRYYFRRSNENRCRVE